MSSKPKYTQDIYKLSPASSRMKEQIAGRLVAHWKENLKGGKSKILAVLMDGPTSQNVLTAEAWSDADQAHAEKPLTPLLHKVVALENGKMTNKGKNHRLPWQANQNVVRQEHGDQDARRQR